MVSDSKVTTDDTWYPAEKIFAHKSELIAMAGDTPQGDRWFEWYTSGKKGSPPKPLDEFCALILRESGLFLMNGSAHEMRVERGFHAIGTGGAAALAVMIAGHDVEEAVKIACQVDAQSGGEIRVMRRGQKR